MGRCRRSSGRASARGRRRPRELREGNEGSEVRERANMKRTGQSKARAEDGTAAEPSVPDQYRAAAPSGVVTRVSNEVSRVTRGDQGDGVAAAAIPTVAAGPRSAAGRSVQLDRFRGATSDPATSMLRLATILLLVA